MLNKAVNYIRETKAELKGVNWPTRKQTLSYTLLVIGASLGVAALLGFFDMGMTLLLEKFIL